MPSQGVSAPQAPFSLGRLARLRIPPSPSAPLPFAPGKCPSWETSESPVQLLTVASPLFSSCHHGQLACDFSFCSTEGGFTPWSRWTPCSVTCGGLGNMSRSRDCAGMGKECLGPRVDIKYCQTPDCEGKGLPTPFPLECLLNKWHRLWLVSLPSSMLAHHAQAQRASSPLPELSMRCRDAQKPPVPLPSMGTAGRSALVSSSPSQE